MEALLFKAHYFFNIILPFYKLVVKISVFSGHNFYCAVKERLIHPK